MEALAAVLIGSLVFGMLLVKGVESLLLADVVCPNCKYRGKPKRFDPNWGVKLILFIGSIIAGFFFPPMFIATAILFFLLGMGQKRVCAECRFEHPIPAGQWDVINKQSQPHTPAAN